MPVSAKAKLAAELILKKRRTVKIEVGDPLDFVFDRQNEVLSCEARILAILAGRRGGKTVVAGGQLLRGALKHSGSLSLYLALSRDSARDIMWPELLEWGKRLGIPDVCFIEHRLRVILPNGAQIIVAGTDDIRHIETRRGSKWAGVIIDECGSQPNELLKSLINLLRPGLTDLQGYLWLIGTPGLTGEGYWWDITNPDRTAKMPLFAEWNMLNNPHLPHAREEMLQVCEENGWIWDEENPTRSTPTFVREWLGKWCIDLGELVYPYSDKLCGFDPANGPHGLPTHNDAGHPLHPEDWRYVIGVDIGYVDDTAIVVMAANGNDVHDYIIQTDLHKHMLTNALSERLWELREDFNGACIVMDSGGMGKYHSADVQERYAVPLEAAEKTEKASYIRLYRDRMLAGRVRIFRGPCNTPLREDYTRLPWDKQKLLPKAGLRDHAADAALYGWRRLNHFTAQDPLRRAQIGSPEWYAEFQRKQLEKVEAEIMAARMQQTVQPLLARFS